MGRKQQKSKYGIFDTQSYPNGTIYIEAKKKAHNLDGTFDDNYYTKLRRMIQCRLMDIAPRHIVVCEKGIIQVHTMSSYDLQAVLDAINDAIDKCKVEPSNRDKEKSREYYEKNKEQILEKQRKYNKEHYAERQEYKKEWRKRTGKN